ncbi:MAG: alpha-amylase family glycosyl hydrolase [bacterium]
MRALAVLLLALPVAAFQTVIQVTPMAPSAPAPARTLLYFDYYQIPVGDWDWQLAIDMVETTSPVADLYLRRGALPTLTDFDIASITAWTANESLLIDSNSTPQIASDTWFLGVFRPFGGAYDLTISLTPLSSPHSGMGANTYSAGLLGEDGVSFRVWAPNADSVHVAGPFNGWSGTASAMANDSAGHWSLDVREIGAGEHYRFAITNGAQTSWKNDSRAREVTQSNGDSIVVDPAAFDWGTVSYSTPAWNDLVIYEMHVGTFFDAPGGAPGSFQSAILKVPYLRDLGITAVELMPVCEFAGDYSWGYNYSHPFSVEQIYGGTQGLRNFVKACHDNGIAVLLDVLYNHWGPSDLDLWRYDGWFTGAFGGIYFYNSILSQTPWGDTRPDFGRAEVRQYIRDNALFWLDEYRLDGLRWDSTSNIRMGPLGDIPDGWSLMQWCNDEIDASQSWKINIAEDMYNAPNDLITQDTLSGGAGFDSQWDALFVHPVRAAMTTPDDASRDMWAVRNAIAQQYNGQATRRVIYTESHDEVANGKSRLPEEIWPGNADSWYSKKRSTLAAAVVMTSPGVPMLFEGQEFLEDGWFTDTDPLDWSKLTQFGGIHDLYRDLIALRRNLAGHTAGLKGDSVNVFHVNNNSPGGKLIAYHRWDQGGPGDDVIVICNFANQDWPASAGYTIGLPAAGTWRVRFNSDANIYDPGYNNFPTTDLTAQPGGYDGLPYHATISIGAYSAVVLSQ